MHLNFQTFDQGFFLIGCVKRVLCARWREVLINGGLKSEGGPGISQLDTGLNDCFKIKPII